MKYKCDICNYIYDSDTGDSEYGFEAGVDLKDLPEIWICPLCGIGAEYFHPLEDKALSSRGEAPLSLMMMALTRSLWHICGRGSCAITREIGRLFISQLKNDGKLTNEEEALKSVKEYFIDSNKFALDMRYIIKEQEVEVEIKNCGFFGLCSQLEDQNVLISTCPYSNTIAAAMEKVTGYRHRISKEQKEYGHKILLKRVSEI